MTAPPLLEVSDLRTHFPTREGVVRAVDGVSFTLDRGEVLGLVGESGSGKTITGFSLLGLVDEPGRIVGGSIRYAGQEIAGLPPARMRRLRGREIAMIFQDPMMTLNPVLTIGRQMQLALAAHGRCGRAEARARAAEILARVGLPDARRRLDDYPHQFSGGMRQRVVIAMALLNRPSLIVADEPTTALDVSIQAQVLAEMKALIAAGDLGMIWISHDLATVSSLARRIAVMYAGRIVEHGATAAVLRHPRHPYTRGLLDSLPSRAGPGQPLPAIPGLAPSPRDRPEGCPFHPRCARASETCRRLDPPEINEGGRSFRCHHPLEQAA